MSNRKIRGQGGFTLIEIIIVIAILSIFVGVIYSSFFGTIRAIRVTEDLTDSFRPARVIMQRIQRDLKGAVHKLKDPRYVFNGIDAYGDDPDRDRIDFITCSHMITDNGIPQSDLTEVSYFIDKTYPGKGYLVRREDLYPDEEPDKGGELRIIGENIAGLNFKYFLITNEEDEEVLSDKEEEEQKKDIWENIADPDNWHDEWDWEENPFLPIMVKIEMTMFEQNEKETTFSTIVFLNRDPGTFRKAQTTTRKEEEGEPRDSIKGKSREVHDQRREVE